ncbi:hypothetical protein SDC9_145262 [bioreactor metagenome]|uniref:Uncharacterized protein n=1 Tax=bioreactor metagenome TaxID=1076179 RepID=A0A645E9H2_9ZZZZ
MKTEQPLGFTRLSTEEINKIEGGVIDPVSVAIGIAAIVVGYACWTASFCYQLGKD